MEEIILILLKEDEGNSKMFFSHTLKALQSVPKVSRNLKCEVNISSILFYNINVECLFVC